MSIADNFKPFPAAATETAWKAAKTEKLRDKWNTELGTALVVAERNYKAIKPDLLDVARIKHAKGEFANAAAVDKAKAKAQEHYDRIVQSAMISLDSAKAKATTASKNVIISKQSRTKAKEIAAALAEPIRVLKAVHLRDFEAEKARLAKA